MSQYEAPADRGFEVIVGLVMLFIALIFAGGLLLLVQNASFHLSSMIGAGVLVFLLTGLGKSPID